MIEKAVYENNDSTFAVETTSYIWSTRRVDIDRE